MAFATAAAVRPTRLDWGIPLGLGIGFICGIMLVLLLRTAFGRTQSVGSASTLVGLFAGVATFWLGGSWATAKFVADLEFEQIRTPYFISSLSVMLTMSLPIAFRYLVAVAREAGRPLQPEQ